MTFQVRDRDTNELLHSTAILLKAKDLQIKYNKEGRRILILKTNNAGYIVGVLKGDSGLWIGEYISFLM